MTVESLPRKAAIGWDIGGANLKMTRVEAGQVVASREFACPLWLGLDRLDAVFEEALREEPGPLSHAITMTGELADLFEDRRAGVAQIAHRAAEHLGADLAIFAGRRGWVDLASVDMAIDEIASANWYATALMAGRATPEGVLVDIGSTTCDIIPISQGRPSARGYSDAERLVTGELVYLGVTRTPLMALTPDVPAMGQRAGVMAEYFGTIADAYAVLGTLPADVRHYSTADNRGTSLPECRARLARQIGRDIGDLDETGWKMVAMGFAEAHLRRIADGAMQVLSGAGIGEGAPLISCGIGAFLVDELARRLGRPVMNLRTLIPAASPDVARKAARYAPSAAVALLAP